MNTVVKLAVVGIGAVALLAVSKRKSKEPMLTIMPVGIRQMLPNGANTISVAVSQGLGRPISGTGIGSLFTDAFSSMGTGRQCSRANPCYDENELLQSASFFSKWS